MRIPLDCHLELQIGVPYEISWEWLARCWLYMATQSPLDGAAAGALLEFVQPTQASASSEKAEALTRTLDEIIGWR